MQRNVMNNREVLTREQVQHVLTVASLHDPNWDDGAIEPYYVVQKPEHITALALMARPLHISDLDTHAFRDVEEFVAELVLQPGTTIWVLPADRLPHIVNSWALESL